MSLGKELKINRLLQQWPTNAVYLTSWLAEKGYSDQLLHRYKKSNWITSVGIGAIIKSGDKATLEGAVFALQQQAEKGVHPGGKTALGLLGKAHYLEFSSSTYTLFGSEKEKLPGWLLKYDWKIKLNYFPTSFLPEELGLVEHEMGGFSIKISGAARALMECMYMAPKNQDLLECYELMEGLNNLRPKVVQQLLENCTSVKVKRLFLYMATKTDHSWNAHLDVSKIDLGSGKRQLVEDGVYVPQYKITVPKVLENDEL